MVVDWHEQSADHDITMTSFVSSRASACSLSPSLALLSSFSPSFLSLLFSLSSPFPSFSLFILLLAALQVWLVVDSCGIVVAVQTMGGLHLGILSRVEGDALSHLMQK